MLGLIRIQGEVVSTGFQRITFPVNTFESRGLIFRLSHNHTDNLPKFKVKSTFFTDHCDRGNSGGAGGQGGRTPPVVLIDDLCEGILNCLKIV